MKLAPVMVTGMGRTGAIGLNQIMDVIIANSLISPPYLPSTQRTYETKDETL